MWSAVDNHPGDNLALIKLLWKQSLDHLEPEQTLQFRIIASFVFVGIWGL